ncbi:MAG: hypothetical protein P8O00_06625 [Candidatus Marinimicrobia bacterium]|jgi:hypothetical protein|nr:hypothetical protein [Candidatus Neomarinimicrobiota bacterium]
MIDQYKYTWKMVKPLIPIIFLALWVILFEEKIWPDWENEIPIKTFSKGELQWEYAMEPSIANDNYRFQFVEFSGKVDTFKNDTLIIDKTTFCKMENSDTALFKNIIGNTVVIKGRILGYNRLSKKLRLDKSFIL